MTDPKESNPNQPVITPAIIEDTPNPKPLPTTGEDDFTVLPTIVKQAE
jgi:hypothetical protein